MPLNQTNLLDKVVNTISEMKFSNSKLSKQMELGLIQTKGEANFWHGEVSIDCKNDSSPRDTFLRLDGWSKGVAFVNGFNLGRYWPIMGPQVMCIIFYIET